MVLDLDGAAAYPGGVLAIGTFDGVHRAHRALLQAAREQADELGTHVLALTFDPHPKEVLMERPPPRLTSLREKGRRLLEAGADHVCALSFDRALAAVSQENFVAEILAAKLAPEACWVGYNFSFGRGGKGRPEDLATLAGRAGFEVQVMPVLDLDGIPVSSTAIRILLSCGDVAEAAARLGKPHRLTGEVIRGDARGRGLGFPTANLKLAPANLMAPKAGVYAGYAEVEGRGRFRAVANVGVRPTFPGAGASLEVHCLDAPGEDFYGATLDLDLIARLRDEQTFSGADALVAQIKADIARVRSLLEPA